MNDRLKEDEEKTDKPQIYCLPRMSSAEKVEDAEKQGHCGEVR
jgi:hypothetical protein